MSFSLPLKHVIFISNKDLNAVERRFHWCSTAYLLTHKMLENCATEDTHQTYCNKHPWFYNTKQRNARFSKLQFNF